MISCGSASTICSVMFIMYIFSITGITQLNPGPPKRLYLPNLSISPRCVGLTILIPAKKKKIAATIITYKIFMLPSFVKTFYLSITVTLILFGDSLLSKQSLSYDGGCPCMQCLSSYRLYYFCFLFTFYD